MREPNKREEEIFQAALEKETPADRAEYLQKICGDDAELFRSVAALLSAHQRAGTFLEETPAALKPDGSGTIRLPDFQHGLRLRSQTEQPGDRIGPYKLLQIIGEGGCGVVYMAEQEQPVHRRVALKIIKVGMDTRQVIARFEVERQALALMEHPNIARVLDAGSTEAGRPFFVMDLVRGIQITDYCDQNNLTTEERLSLFQQVCHAIQHAHQKGVIHRDIKPSNILVTLHDGDPVPVIIDFGIAKATEQRLTEKTLFTAFEQFLGTPAYMSPEQAEMSRLDIDTRSDIYSLGVLLYELLTGRTPFDSKALLEAGLDQIRRTIREKEPVRPSTRLRTMLEADLGLVARHRRSEPLRLIHLLRGDLDWIVMKSLEKDRTRRYETANGLALDLQRYLQDEPVLARPPSRLYRLRKMVRRNRVACAAGGAVAAALLIGLTVSTWLFFLEKEAYRRAILAERSQSRLLADAETARQREAAQSRTSETNAQRSRLNSYAADINSAFLALDSGNLGRTMDLLDRQIPRPGEADLRGFEWRLLWQQSRGDEISSLPHPAMVSCAIFTPDAQGAFTACYDGLVRFWDLPSRQIIRTIPGFERQTGWRYIALSPDGHWLAGIRSDKLTVWDLRDGGFVVRHEEPSACRVIAFTKEGNKVVAWGSSGLTLLDTQTWQVQILRTKLQPESYPCLAIDRTGKLAALAHEGSHSVEVWELDTGMLARHFDVPIEPGAAFVSLAWSPDGLLAAGTWSGMLLLVDTRRGELLASTSAHSGSIFGLAFTPDAKTVVTAGHDQLIRFWSLPELTSTATLRGHRDEIWSLSCAQDGRTLCTAGKDGTAKIWTPAAKPAPVYITNWFARSFTHDGRSFVTLSEPTTDLSLDFWDVENPGVRTTRTLPVGNLTNLVGVVLSSDAKLLALGKSNGEVEVWSSETGKRMAALRLSQSAPVSLAFSDHSRLLAVGTEQGTIEVWNFGTGQTTRFGTTVPRRIGAIEFINDGHYLRVEQKGQPSGQIWDAKTGAAIPIPLAPTETFVISPDGHTVAVVSTNYSVKLLDFPSFRERAILRGHHWTIHALAFSADSKLLATGSLDAVARLWDVVTGAEVTRPLRGHFQGVTDLAFSPDAKVLVTGSTDNTVKVWHVETGRELFSVADASAPAFSPDGNSLLLRTSHGLQLLHVPSREEIDLARRIDAGEG